MIKVIIFDLDGLMVDSQPLQYKSVKLALEEKGYSLTMDDWYYWVHDNIGYKEWIERKNLPLRPEELRARKKEIYEHLIKTELELKPGARQLINLLEGKFRLAIASGSRIETIEACVDKFNLRSKFDHLITDQGMNVAKPDPEVFLHVAKIMSVNPTECLVLEDSLAGLKAAKGAGMKCIVCPDTFVSVDRKLYEGADKIVDSLEEVTLENIN